MKAKGELSAHTPYFPDTYDISPLIARPSSNVSALGEHLGGASKASLAVYHGK